MEQKEASPRQDIACVRCRERKVRCGRERPVCVNCQDDRTKCRYSQPEKRVNHIKLLCDNFDSLEHRLDGIESKLSWLTTLFKTGYSQQSIAGSELLDSTAKDATSITDPRSTHIVSDFLTDKRIVRGHNDQGDQYHGPCTLVSLCYDLKESVLDNEKAEKRAKENTISSCQSNTSDDMIGVRTYTKNDQLNTTTANHIIERMYLIASFEPTLEIPENISIRLPPKQLLLTVLPQFFSQGDFSIDIFAQRRLRVNLERTYSRPATPDNCAWAVAFHIIILLVLGSESSARGSEPLMGSQFSQPFLHAMRAALHWSPLLTTPKLINVQALVLLSIAAERYQPTSNSSAIFAQACLLAKRIGLHDNLTQPTEIDQDEAEERRKTFMSLHLRDKMLSLSWSSICWLPTLGPLNLQLNPSTFADVHVVARFHLAEIQEQLYRCVAAETSRTASMASDGILSLHRRMRRWADNYSICTLSSLPQSAQLELTFLGTRMLANSLGSVKAQKQAILEDARMCCLILLVSYEKHDQNTLKMLQILRNMSTSHGRPTLPMEDEYAALKKNTTSVSRFTWLVDAFPIMAFFQLAKHILWHRHSTNRFKFDEEKPSDLKLLRDVYECFVEANSKTQSDNRARQTERVFGCVLELLQQQRQRTKNDSLLSPCVGPDPVSQTLWSEADIPVLRTDSSSHASVSPASPATFSESIDTPSMNAVFGLDGLPYGGEYNRKRQRIGDLDFCVDGNSLDFCAVVDRDLVQSFDLRKEGNS